jgi:hypothetical protein
VKAKTVSVTLLLLATMAAGLSAQAPELFFPLDRVTAGLHGVGKTIFRGDHIEEFGVEILGVVENTGPRQSMILARLSGGPLAEAGVIQGMSGSPVYIDGKLVGAVAFGFPFAKQAIAGIQPISQMLDDATFSVGGRRASGAASAWNTSLFPGARDNPLFRAIGDSGSAHEAWDTPFGAMREIETPLAMSGFTERTRSEFSGPLAQLGLRASSGLSGGRSATQTKAANVEPGSMISVELMTGDMMMSADGTVTYVDGKRIYAFGHRFLAVGSTELPFSRSEVLAILPNLSASTKISAAREWVGTITSDRSTSVAGEIGRKAAMVPVEIEVKNPAGAPRHYHIEVVADRLLTPFLTQTAMFSAIDATERTLGVSSVRVEGRVEFEGGVPPLIVRNMFSSELSAAGTASANSVAPFSFVLQSGFDALKVRRVSYVVEPEESKRMVEIEQAWAARHDVRPGETVGVSVLLTGDNGLEVTRSAEFRLPMGIPAGPLNLTVSDANGLNLPELMNLAAVNAATPEALIRELNAIRPSDRAYVRVWRAQPSYPVSGRELGDPPPSVSLVLTRGMSAGPALLLAARGTTLGEMVLDPGDYVVSGAKTIQVEVKP